MDIHKFMSIRTRTHAHMQARMHVCMNVMKDTYRHTYTHVYIVLHTLAQMHTNNIMFVYT